MSDIITGEPGLASSRHSYWWSWRRSSGCSNRYNGRTTWHTGWRCDWCYSWWQCSHAAAEAIDPTREEAYWRAEYANVDYYKEGYDFDRDLHPAYAVGYANRARYPADARF